MGRIGRILERNNSTNKPMNNQKTNRTFLNQSNKKDFNYLDLKWLNKIYSSYKSGVSNQFILVGNIYDFAYEHYRLKAFIEKVFTEEKNLFLFDKIKKYNVKGQYTELINDNENVLGDWDAMIADIGNSNKGNEKSLYLMEYPQFIIPATENVSDSTIRNTVTLHSALKSNEMIMSTDMVIFIAESTKDIHPMFLQNQSEVIVVDIPYPNEEQRLNFVEYLIKQEEHYNDLFREITPAQLARMTSGLTLLNIENILMQADFEGSLNNEVIFNKKRNLIRKEFGEIIEIFDSNGLTLDDFAGQEHLKQYHKEVIIEPILEGNTSIVPKGLLYVGPPGTGKTYFANCLSGSAKINFVEFKMSKILDVYVGQAERNLERALKCFESLAPVGVFIDEIEQVLSRGQTGDNHVVKNIFSMFLSFLSNPKHRGKIIWIGATNYPNMLDEALKRPGRFDKKIPFFPPEKEERVLIFNLHLKKHKISINGETIKSTNFIEKTEGYSQAEIENVVIKVVELMHRKKIQTINVELLNQALDSMTSSKSRETIKEMIDIALEECNDKEFIPKQYRDKVK